ncbi:type II toxin-antitoxin system VapC family toxin [Candidatus Saccharibacteria bacterium]|nr:MAG: type II toxin-antitoxin system VapC family toxin [Candidatus Saccharibacteria bacterium]
MRLVDTNIILRWLLGDHRELSQTAEQLVDRAKNASLLVTDVVVAEIVYVLRATGRDRQQVSEALLLIGRMEAFKYENEELIMKVIGLLTDTNLDFADCYLLAKARQEKLGLETFDKPLEKLYRLG